MADTVLKLRSPCCSRLLLPLCFLHRFHRCGSSSLGLLVAHSVCSHTEHSSDGKNRKESVLSTLPEHRGLKDSCKDLCSLVLGSHCRLLVSEAATCAGYISSRAVKDSKSAFQIPLGSSCCCWPLLLQPCLAVQPYLHCVGGCAKREQ